MPLFAQTTFTQKTSEEQLFAIPFDFISMSHISAIMRVEDGPEEPYTGAITFIDNNQVRLPDLPLNSFAAIVRSTPKDIPVTFLSGNPILASDLNLTVRTLFFIFQEICDDLGNAAPVVDVDDSTSPPPPPPPPPPVSPSLQRFWRVFVNSTHQTNDLAVVLREAEFMDTVGGTDLTTGETGVDIVSTVNLLALSEIGANLYDDDASTAWVSAGDPGQFFGYEFNEAVDIVQFSITSAPQTSQFPREIELQHSPDGIVWTTLSTHETPQPSAFGERQVYTVS